MSHTVLTDMTKKVMAESLKKLMTSKPLNKITIKEITDDCGLNRQTFYYHFCDIYDLLEWMYRQEALVLLHQHDSCLTWEDGFFLLLRYIQENKDVSLCTLNSLGREHLEEFFYKDIYNLVLSIINELAGDLQVSDYHKDFIAHFYTTALSALTINWLRDGMKETPEELIYLVSVTLQGNIHNALARFAQTKCV